MKTYLIFGASSAIAKATSKLLIEEGHAVVAISRCRIEPAERLVPIRVADYHDADVAEALASIPKRMPEFKPESLDGVYLFNGILHGKDFQPEKALSQLDETAFLDVMRANALAPAIIIQQLLHWCSKQAKFKIAALSARIGSLGDNHLGGWYSYRASKAALNMLLNNIAIECARSHKNIKLISYHPGTTDSPLSKPFQANVPDEQLFSARKSANYFLEVVDQQDFDNELSYVDWQGNKIQW